MTAVVELVKKNCRRPICAKPNAGTPKVFEGKEVYRATPEQMAERVPDRIHAGAQMVSGCCGTTPEHLRKIADRATSTAVSRN